jgi:D-amino peptidase
VLSHTYTDSIARITLNDMIAGEATLNGALAGSRNVPVLLVSGDNTVAEEITGWQTGTVPVITKFGISRSAGKMLHPEQVDQNYSNAVSQVFKTQIKPFNPTPPYRLEIFFRETQMTDIVVRIPGTRRSGDNSVIFEAADYQTLFRAFLAIQTISSHNYLK